MSNSVTVYNCIKRPSIRRTNEQSRIQQFETPCIRNYKLSLIYSYTNTAYTYTNTACGLWSVSMLLRADKRQKNREKWSQGRCISFSHCLPATWHHILTSKTPTGPPANNTNQYFSINDRKSGESAKGVEQEIEGTGDTKLSAHRQSKRWGTNQIRLPFNKLNQRQACSHWIWRKNLSLMVLSSDYRFSLAPKTKEIYIHFSTRSMVILKTT